MISDIILMATLFANAGAILNFKLEKKKPDINSFDSLDQPQTDTFYDRFREFLLSLRYFRIFIGIWNLVVIFLMFIIFSG